MLIAIRSQLRALWLWLSGIPECTSCGVCCAPGRWRGPTDDTRGYVYVTDSGMRRLRGHERETYVVGGAEVFEREVRPGDHTSRFLRIIQTRGPASEQCSALTGIVGRFATCAIYERRPDACVTFVRGGDWCRVMLKRSRIADPVKRASAHPWPFRWRAVVFFIIQEHVCVMYLTAPECPQCGGERLVCEQHRGPWGAQSLLQRACDRDCAGPGERCPSCSRD